jgi:hypothetical protein
VVVTGYSHMSKTSGALFDQFLTIKYDASGNQQWVRTRSTAQVSDHAMDVVVDASGNAYVTGFSLVNIDNSTSRKSFVTVKYSPEGQELWASSYAKEDFDAGPFPLPNNPTFEAAGHIALDPSGNVYVAGNEDRGETRYDFLLLKYDPATGALVWNRNWSKQFDDVLRDMAIDAGGNIYLTGESYDGDYYSATFQSTSDVATVKFDGAGNQLWERIYRGFPGKWDGGRSVALDAAGNAYVGLLSEGFVNDDTAVVKYQPDGTEEWVFRYDNREHSDDSLQDMAVDASGNIYLAGTAALTNVNGNETQDLLTVKLAPSGQPINSPPSILLRVVGPTIAGGPGRPGDEPDGPTIAGRTMTLNASASDRDGTVLRVDFYDGETLIGSDTTAPYSFEWTNAPLGLHAIIAGATDNSGATRASETASVLVMDTVPQMSLSGHLKTSAGAPIANLPVFLNNTRTHNVLTGMTDAQGYYNFGGLTPGSSFVVMPYGPYTFQPGSMSVQDIQNNMTFDFVGASTDPPGCAYSLSLASRNFAASGGDSNFAINAEKGCSWKARSNNNWIMLTGQTDGSGQTPISYRVLENTSATSRTGTISVAGQTFTVTQDAGSAVCTVSLTQTNETFGAFGGEATLNVNAGSGCSWSAVSNDSWITIDAGGTGLGPGTVSYSVLRNSGAFRTGTINIGGQIFNVEQKAGDTGQ